MTFLEKELSCHRGKEFDGWIGWRKIKEHKITKGRGSTIPFTAPPVEKKTKTSGEKHESKNINEQRKKKELDWFVQGLSQQSCLS